MRPSIPHANISSLCTNHNLTPVKVPFFIAGKNIPPLSVFISNVSRTNTTNKHSKTLHSLNNFWRLVHPWAGHARWASTSIWLYSAKRKIILQQANKFSFSLIHNSDLCPTYFPTSSSNTQPEMLSYYNHQFWNRRRSIRTYQALHQPFFYFVSVLTIDQISCARCPVRGKIAIFPQSWTIDPHFLRKMPGGR